MTPSLTTQQLAALKAAVLADPVLAPFLTAGNDGPVADALNLSTSFVVWRTDVPAATIFGQIVWANLTPVDPPDGTAAFTNRALVCQAKQINLQILLQGRTTPFDASNTRQRGGLQDALQNVPAGVGGTLLDAGWASGVRSALLRQATRAEQLLASGTGTTQAPGLLGAEGWISPAEVSRLRD